MRKRNKKRSLFVFQISPLDHVPPAEKHGEALKLIKCVVRGAQREFSRAAAVHLPAGSGDEDISRVLKDTLSAWGYRREEVRVSLPRRCAMLRTLKIPAVDPGEIGKILSLQASKFIPHSSHELITGYQLISTDAEGYSVVTLVVVHREMVERYLRIFRRAGIRRCAVTLSSYGLSSLYHALEPMDTRPVMIVDISAGDSEAAIVRGGKLLMSRWFRIHGQHARWPETAVEQLRKTREIHHEETGEQEQPRIVITASLSSSAAYEQDLQPHISSAVTHLRYWERVKCSPEFLGELKKTGDSFASLLGLALADIPGELNLIPEALKYHQYSLSRLRGVIVNAGLLCAAVFVLMAGMVRSMDNRERYLESLHAELSGIEEQARPLEALQQKFGLLKERMRRPAPSLMVLRELHVIVPPEVILVSLAYEENRQVILKGQAPELAPVFTLVGALEDSPVFKEFNIKMQYASARKSEGGQIVTFEVVCAKK